MCRWINTTSYNLKGCNNLIPENIINKDPSAELKFNQKDSDSLPPYEILDNILEQIIDKNKDLKSIIKGFNKSRQKIWTLIKIQNLRDIKAQSDRNLPPCLC